jgi:hypothetical protein
MSWLSEFVFDPIEDLIAAAERSSDPTVATLAGPAKVATVPTPPAVTGSLETEVEGAIQTFVDGIIVAGVGHEPVIGELLEKPLVDAANAGLDYAESHLAAYASGLIASAKVKLAGVVAPTA